MKSEIIIEKIRYKSVDVVAIPSAYTSLRRKKPEGWQQSQIFKKTIEQKVSQPPCSECKRIGCSPKDGLCKRCRIKLGRTKPKKIQPQCQKRKQKHLDKYSKAIKMKENKHAYCYILRLTNNKWYIGWTIDLQRRIEEHFSGEGAKWTQLHKPIEVLLTRQGCLETENKLTLAMMKQYGIHNVRGGKWVNLDFHDKHIKKLKRLLAYV